MDMEIIKNHYCFDCKMCGECCTGNTEVYVNLYDMYKLCTYLKLDHTRDLFERGLLRPAIAENGGWIPRLQFRKKPLQFCPFVINDMDDDFHLKCYCRLHPNLKPLICKLAPVGRIIDCNTEEINYVSIPPVKTCPGMKSNHLRIIEDLEKDLQDELDYDFRFYMILDTIINTTEWTREITEELYYFPVNESFETVLEDLEYRYCAGNVL
ncbi:MAG: hypothetical protein OQK82_03240 [Candidatus Pacearchaeota archaeon]|nr:hypothetical protein [Candidatus Pacearchaeota archaeon]